MDDSVESLLNLMSLFRNRLIQPFEQSHRGSISRLQYNILRSLREKGPLSMSELASEMNISKQQLTPLIYKLLEKGLIDRGTDDKDHRVVLIAFNEAGHVCLENIRTTIITVFRKHLEQASDEDLEILQTSLINLNRLLNELFQDK